MCAQSYIFKGIIGTYIIIAVLIIYKLTCSFLCLPQQRQMARVRDWRAWEEECVPHKAWRLCSKSDKVSTYTQKHNINTLILLQLLCITALHIESAMLQHSLDTCPFIVLSYLLAHKDMGWGSFFSQSGDNPQWTKKRKPSLHKTF